MTTQSEIIAGANALLDHPEIKVALTKHTDWETTRHARVIVKRVLDVAKKMRER